MGAIVNALAIIVCGTIGMVFNTGISPRFHERLMQGVGLCVMTLGISGVIQGEQTIVMIISVVVGTLIGEGIDFDRLVTRGVKVLEEKVQHLEQFPQGACSGSDEADLQDRPHVCRARFCKVIA